MKRDVAVTNALSGMILLLQATIAVGQVPAFRSHPPIRPLPVASTRPLGDGPAYYVDVKHGSDQGNGSQAKPWKTLAHAVRQLKPGDTLCLRSGTYNEHVKVAARGTETQPITIRSAPGELAVIDGGMREFFETPATAWEPFPAGAAGEFRSVKTYPNLGGSDGGTNVLGLFGDSMVPLHGYRNWSDLRTSNEYFYKLDAAKTAAGDGVYCGPGVYYDVETERIHVRLAHTHQKALGDDNYRGETDPRKIPLVIAGLNAGPALSVDESRFVRFQDIAVRGARTSTVSVTNSVNNEFDGVTAYGGSSAFGVNNSAGLRVWNCALRGIAAPWTYRGSLKYRAIEAKIFAASGWTPTTTAKHDFELAYSEFTDCVDGVFIGNVKNVRFHHNLLDNVSDDGMFLTSTTGVDGTTPGGNIHIYQNLLSRCLTTFAFGVGHGRQKMTPTGRQTGAGVFIYRNIFDFRRPVMYSQPREDATEITSYGRVAGDHGGPLWEPMTIYHNTILQMDTPFRSYYLAGMGSHMAGGSRRRLLNNIVVHADGRPGSVLPPVVTPQTVKKFLAQANAKKPRDPLGDLLEGDLSEKGKTKFSTEVNSKEIAKLEKEMAKKAAPKAPLLIEFQADGNLHWSYSDPQTEDTLFSRFRNSPDFAGSKAWHRAGWTANDRVADPQFVTFNSDWSAAVDPRLQPGSPALNVGVAVPKEWPDPLRNSDSGKPDVGAIPAGMDPWRVGVRGRLTVFGQTADPSAEVVVAPATFPVPGDQIAESRVYRGKPIAILQGYPASDARLIRFVLTRNEIPFETIARRWLDPAEYSKYAAVIVVGNLARAKIEPNRYSEDDLQFVQNYLEHGGKLALMRGNVALFSTQHGRPFLTRLTGTSRGTNEDAVRMLQPKHPWLKHLDPKKPPAWINARHMNPIRASQTESMILGSPDRTATLFNGRVGNGQLIYFGWDVAASMPHGRSLSTVEQEAAYEQQFHLLTNMIESLSEDRNPKR